MFLNRIICKVLENIKYWEINLLFLVLIVVIYSKEVKVKFFLFGIRK